MPIPPEDRRRIERDLKRLKLHDIPAMTVREHHGLCIGILATCYENSGPELQRAIAEMLHAAKAMGMDIKPELVTDQKKLSE